MDLIVDDSSAPVRTTGAALVWRRRWLVVLAAGLGLLASVVYLHTVTYRYTATMTVTPVQANSAALPGGLSSLASLAGVQIGRGEVAKPFVLYIQSLSGYDVAALLAADPAFKRHVFPAEWDDTVKQWRQPPSLTRGLVNIAKSVLGIPVRVWAPPGPQDVRRWLDDHLSVAEDPKNGIAQISLRDADPGFAVATLSRLNALADEDLRARELARTTDYIAYLERTIATVTLAEHRTALAATLGEQERKRMIASANTAYAAELLGPIVAGNRPDSPNPVLTLAAGLGFGLLAGLLAALNWPERRRS